MNTERNFLELVKKEVGEALALEAGRMDADSLLRGDLGAESIDLIDLTFRFEKSLGRPLKEEEIFRPGKTAGDLSLGEIADNLQGAMSSA